jgi:mono/diheme cytochrome c family protein
MKAGAMLCIVIFALVACKREDMYSQKAIRQWDSDPSAQSGSSIRPPVAGTLAREQPDAPVPAPSVIDAALLARGQARYEIFCTPCHGQSGDGEGAIVQRGFAHPPRFTGPRLRQASARVFYNAITYGHGAMYSYAARVPPSDRWAIAAYIRALQLSQDAIVATLPREDQQMLARIVGNAQTGGAP